MSLIRPLQRKPDGEIVFREPTSGEVPANAILSHTWREEEVIYQDLKKGKELKMFLEWCVDVVGDDADIAENKTFRYIIITKAGAKDTLTSSPFY